MILNRRAPAAKYDHAVVHYQSQKIGVYFLYQVNVRVPTKIFIVQIILKRSSLWFDDTYYFGGRWRGGTLKILIKSVD